jgi:hypothetical protein
VDDFAPEELAAEQIEPEVRAQRVSNA